MTQAVAAEILAKRFGDVEAVSDVSFEVQQGEFFGFLGPNGAGKTTTINMLTGLARPDSGAIRIGGVDCIAKPRSAQNLIGVVPDESNLYPELTGMENLCFCGALYGIGKAERMLRAGELLESFDLTQAADRKFAGYSKGMKRKLTIAAGIIHRPKILFLDEPTTGIDVASARQVRQLVASLHREGTTIFLTTHYIEEAERLCDRIAFIVSGVIRRIDSVENLLQPVQNQHVLLISLEQGAHVDMNSLQEAFPELELSLADDLLRAETHDPIRVAPLIRMLEDKGVEVLEARKARPSLEDVFIRITGLDTSSLNREKEKESKSR